MAGGVTPPFRPLRQAATVVTATLKGTLQVSDDALFCLVLRPNATAVPAVCPCISGRGLGHRVVAALAGTRRVQSRADGAVVQSIVVAHPTHRPGRGVWHQPTCSQPGRRGSRRRIVPRNTCSHVPMYGCIGPDDGAPMTVAYIVDAAGHVAEDWAAWLVQHSGPGLSAVLHIGHDRRWPTDRMDESRVRRLLPLLCSINPLGTPCYRLRLPDPTTGVGVSRAAEDGACALRRTLGHLAGWRRMSRATVP